MQDTFSVMRFHPGKTVATGGVAALANKGLDIYGLLQRHVRGDWGDLDEHDKAINEAALSQNNPGRLMSSYETEFGKIWIITEADRSVTTALLPDEY